MAQLFFYKGVGMALRQESMVQCKSCKSPAIVSTLVAVDGCVNFSNGSLPPNLRPRHHFCSGSNCKAGALVFSFGGELFLNEEFAELVTE